jgi:hypothetical protein
MFSNLLVDGAADVSSRKPRTLSDGDEHQFFSKSFVLQPRASLQVSRASRGELYTLRYGHSEETRVSVAAEQIALFAAEGINFLPRDK